MNKKFTREEDSVLKSFVDGNIEFSDVEKLLPDRKKSELEARIAYLSILFSGKDLKEYGERL